MADEEIIELQEEPTIEPTQEPTEPPTIEPFVIPNIYRYSKDTKEYIGSQPADRNPAESNIKGQFVPLVPANATLLEPPAVEENQIQVYSRTVEPHEEPYEVIDEETGDKLYAYKEVNNVIEVWNIESDYRKNFLKVDNDLNVYPITSIGEQEDFIIVEKATGEDIQADKNRYKIVDGEIVKKSQEEYNAERLSNLRKEKEFENAQKAKQAVEQGYVEFKDAQFETNAQTVGDLTATMLLMQSTGLEVYSWLSRDDKVVELSVEDFGTLGSLIAGFKNTIWNDKYLTYKNAIAKAKTLTELKKVVIDYGTETE